MCFVFARGEFKKNYNFDRLLSQVSTAVIGQDNGITRHQSVGLFVIFFILLLFVFWVVLTVEGQKMEDEGVVDLRKVYSERNKGIAQHTSSE